MPLTKISKQVLWMKKFIRILGLILLLTYMTMTIVLYSNPELTPIGGAWFFLVMAGFVGFQFYYYLANKNDQNENLVKGVIITTGLLWFSAMLLLLFEPEEFIPASQIAVMIVFLTINYRLFVTRFKSLILPSKIYLSVSSVLFVASIYQLIHVTNLPSLSEFIRFRTTFHTVVILMLIAVDHVIIDLLQAEKDLSLKIANEKTLNLKSTLLNEVEKHIHKPLNLLRVSLESVRLNTFGEPREITENGIKQVNQIERYLGSISKVNRIEESKEVPTLRVLKEFSIVYRNWISFNHSNITDNSKMNNNEIFGLRTLLDYAMYHKSKYCSLETTMVNNKPCFEITFDGPGMTDSFLKLNLQGEIGSINEGYDLKIAFRLLQKEGYIVMLSSQLLQGSRFLIICEDADIKEHELPGKVNTVV